MPHRASVWVVAAACCCGTAAAQGVNGAITGHQHSTPSSCNAPNLGTGSTGGAMGTVHSPLVQENDRSVQTSVETVSTTGVAGYTTYTITLHLQSTAQNCYTIYGDSRPLMFPPAFQVAVPFGTNVGGVNVALFQVNPLAQFDSWVTVGETLGNANNDVSSIGIDFTTWSDTVALVSATDSGGAVFWMDPDKATAAVSAQRTMVVAQLTLRDAASQFTSQIVHFDAQGRSTGHPIGTHSAAAAGPSDWEENCIEVLVGGSQNGQGSHSVLSAANAPLVMGGACVMLTNPQGGSWQYNQLNFGDGTAATLQCMGGFYAPAGAQMQKMCHNGQWAGGATAQCMSAQPCTAITPYPVAGQYTYSNRDYIPGSRATLTCTAGWYLSNDNVVKVCQSGVWVPDTSINPGNTAYNFAMCSNTDARGPGGLYDANGHLAVTVHCQDKRTEYFSDTCFIEPISHDQRTQVQCSAMGSKCRWVVDLTTDGTPGGAHGTTCQHCASTVQGTPPPSPPPTPPAAKSSSGGTVFVVVLVILLAGGGYVAFDKKLGPFAPKTERTSSLTDPGGGAPATIYDKQTDDSL